MNLHPDPKSTAVAGRRPVRARRWLALAALLATAALRPEVANAQIIALSSASVVEGNSGSVVLKIPVNFIGAQPNTVTGTVSAVPLSGVAFNPATSGTACGAGVDFVGFTNVPFSIPPNTPNGTLSINVEVCGDTVNESNEHIFVSLVASAGAECTGDSCGAIGTIIDDDDAPTMSINNISTSEPLSGAKKASFTVTLSHASTVPTTVNFRTRDGTARAACALCNPPVLFPDYNATSGTLTIPALALSGKIFVIINADPANEGSQTFFVDLSAPVNATLADRTGQATIIDNSLFIGGFDLTPADVVARVGETFDYTLEWTVPPNLVWRNLKSLDLRLRHGHRTAAWLRWDEASNRFSLCQRVGQGNADDDSDDDDANASRRGRTAAAAAVSCGAGVLPGSGDLLMTPYVVVRMDRTKVTGSGPTGQGVTLQIALTPRAAAAGTRWRAELGAADDFGNVDDFVRGGTLEVQALRSRH